MSRMRRLAARGKRSRKSKRLGEPEVVSREEYAGMELDSRLELIRSLVPVGLMAVYQELDREVVSLAGVRHSRKSGGPKHYRHGTNPGTVRFLGQRVPIEVPRVRGPEGEVRLESYDNLHRGGGLDELLFRRVLYGISSRNYERAAEQIPGAIGLSSSTVSREFVEASAAKLREFQERDLTDLDLVVLFLDGKTFADDEMVIALGVMLSGEKQILGFVQTETENERVVAQFVRSLLDRGLDTSSGLLVVIDGSKGLRSAIRKVLRRRAVVQRCQWHKRENVVSHLPRKEQSSWRGRLQRAYGRPTYDEAKRELLKIRDELAEINESAVRSLDEGFEETLTLHRLGLFAKIGRSLKTTNILESVNSQAEERCGRVDHWQNSKQKQRWLAAALLDIEPRLRRLVGYRHLPALQAAIMKELKLGGAEERSKRAA
ncbi:MAG: IS256 family transposase [Gemmatimonadetes bacterium]|nr:IS256 family transposase [Gemmatimonadota bacterium]